MCCDRALLTEPPVKRRKHNGSSGLSLLLLFMPDIDRARRWRTAVSSAWQLSTQVLRRYDRRLHYGEKTFYCDVVEGVDDEVVH